MKLYFYFDIIVLCLENYIKTDGARYTILANGLKELSELKNNKRQKQFENRIAVINIIIPVISFAVGLLVEHFSNIISVISSFIDSCFFYKKKPLQIAPNTIPIRKKTK